MANVVISLVSKTDFIGTPIVYSVKATNVGQNAVFHRVRLRVNTTFNSASASFEFSAPAENLETIKFDISSALRAATCLWQPTATPPQSYPTISFTLDAMEDYMINGTPYEGVNTAHNSGDTVWMGKLSDFERIKNVTPSRFSHKPTTSPEIVHNGKTLIVPGSTTSISPTVRSILVGTDSLSGVNAYAIDPPNDSYEIRFINSLGVHETVHVTSLITDGTAMQKEDLVISRQETVTDFSRRLYLKDNDHEQWKMSSGPLDKAWAAWFAHEFLTAEWAWINISNTWVPCHIIPDETINYLNRKDNTPIEVPFTIELDIKGSPY